MKRPEAGGLLRARLQQTLPRAQVFGEDSTFPALAERTAAGARGRVATVVCRWTIIGRAADTATLPSRRAAPDAVRAAGPAGQSVPPLTDPYDGQNCSFCGPDCVSCGPNCLSDGSSCLSNGSSCLSDDSSCVDVLGSPPFFVCAVQDCHHFWLVSVALSGNHLSDVPASGGCAQIGACLSRLRCNF